MVCKSSLKVSSQDGRYPQTAHSTKKSVIKNIKHTLDIEQLQKTSSFYSRHLDVCIGCVWSVRGHTCLSDYQPFSFTEGEHFCGFEAAQLHLSTPFVYIFLLIITSVALGISLWSKCLPWEANFPERTAGRTDEWNNSLTLESTRLILPSSGDGK